MVRILIIEDNPGNLQLMTYLLKAFGHQTLSADHGGLGIEMAQQESPDLVLCDLHMPGQDGFHFVRAIKSDTRLAAIPFVFIGSSVWGERDRQTARQLGVTRFLLRPMQPQALLAEILASLTEQVEGRDGVDTGRR